ncbi:MAG: RluA family pseudouridine synthase [Clostridiales bacterium]|jgi:23S rRNA pseudouridine1911/1915/1917 synthase|nr:RluA family pseudouridine synthase [Clostridiales bacterium]
MSIFCEALKQKYDTGNEKCFCVIFNEVHAQRIDKFLAKHFSKFTRSHLQKLIREKNVLVNDKLVNSSRLLKMGDRVVVCVPRPKPLSVAPQEISLDIVYEDEDIIVVNKPSGMVVHPACGNYDGTLVNALLNHCKENLSGINDVLRPGIVHRIDKDTTGLLLVAKNDKAHLGLSNQIKFRSLTREYKAIVHGCVCESGVVNKPIGRSSKDRKKMAVIYRNSKEAITNFFPIEVFEKYTLVRLKLETGRTHQIRVHMKFLGYPIVGDKTYGAKNEEFLLSGQLLHAYRLKLDHPISGEHLEFERDPPQEFVEVLKQLRCSVGF